MLCSPQIGIDIRLQELTEEDAEEGRIEIMNDQYTWAIASNLQVCFSGQPGIYGEKFIRTRLAEEAAAAGLCGSQR